MGRVSGRDRHSALLKRGIRIRNGSIEMIYLYEKTNIPCLAFAIPKSVGTAVQRNKIRRQYREIFTKIVKSDPRKVAQGNYLVKVHSTHSENSKNETVLTKILNELYEYNKKQK